mmetsp:Transcript_20365/g.53461  ORF Transcript_20365/g.53461 Transcript_20365/m.53461 type:complete len:207 (-) Transcript_20365:843-1463(-)
MRTASRSSHSACFRAPESSACTTASQALAAPSEVEASLSCFPIASSCAWRSCPHSCSVRSSPRLPPTRSRACRTAQLLSCSTFLCTSASAVRPRQTCTSLPRRFSAQFCAAAASSLISSSRAAAWYVTNSTFSFAASRACCHSAWLLTEESSCSASWPSMTPRLSRSCLTLPASAAPDSTPPSVTALRPQWPRQSVETARPPDSSA